MDIQALNLFVRSMEMGNITAAGAELGSVRKPKKYDFL